MGQAEPPLMVSQLTLAEKLWGCAHLLVVARGLYAQSLSSGN